VRLFPPADASGQALIDDDVKVVRDCGIKPSFASRSTSEAVKKCLTAETAENAWFDELTMSAQPEPVEGCVAS